MYLSMYFYAYVDDFLRWKKSNADNLWKMFSAYKTILKPNPEKSCYVKQVA